MAQRGHLDSTVGHLFSGQHAGLPPGAVAHSGLEEPAPTPTGLGSQGWKFPSGVP